MSATSLAAALAGLQSGGTVNPTAAAGTSTAPGASTVVADTGQLAAGTYRLEATLGFSDTLAAGKHIMVEHRNAANNAIVATLALCPAGAAMGDFVVSRLVVALNERVRAITGSVVGAAGSVAQASIRATLLEQ